MGQNTIHIHLPSEEVKNLDATIEILENKYSFKQQLSDDKQKVYLTQHTSAPKGVNESYNIYFNSQLQTVLDKENNALNLHPEATRSSIQYDLEGLMTYWNHNTKIFKSYSQQPR